MMNDRPTFFVNLLIYLNTEHMLLGSRRRFDVSGWCIHRFQWQRSNFDGKFVHFNGCTAKKNRNIWI